ncbi:MAG TPA: amidohydrolase [Candidatus Acidoferrales bacterium]|nr:amidohydrolase [Candidatus Acidoferrales bacterium]
MRYVAILLASAAPLFAADADLILHNGKIVTVDNRLSIQQAVAVRSGTIIAVGTDAAVLQAERGPKTEVIDLRARTVLPGLVDAHVHALEAGLSEFRAPLPPLDSFAAVQQFIRKQAARAPTGAWIVVPRTFPTRLKEMRMPTREVLDIDQDHPVLFDASYVVILNSYALSLCGIDRHTPNPPGGEIVKDANGEPNGILKNAQSLVKGLDRSAHFTESEKLDALEQQLKRYLAAGLTTVGDRAVDAEQIDLYRKLKAAGRLPVRAVLTWRPDGSRPAAELQRQIEAAPYTTSTGDSWLKFGTFKLTLDGGMTIGTAYQRYPYGPFGRQLYGKTDPDDRGQLFIPPDKLLAVMRTARDRGWQLTTHDQGGGAVDTFLDTLEALDREKPIAPTRSHVMHASFQSPEAIARMKKLGILADVQAAWLYLDAPALEQVFGYEGMRYFYPLRSYIDGGVILAAGSDHMIGHDKNTAVNPYNPFLSMWTEVTRLTNRGKAIHPEERITRIEALKSHTIWAAWLQFAENERGSIEPGKLADMVVIDRDYLTCPETQIKDIQPLLTMLNGRIAHRAPAFH